MVAVAAAVAEDSADGDYTLRKSSADVAVMLQAMISCSVLGGAHGVAVAAGRCRLCAHTLTVRHFDLLVKLSRAHSVCVLTVHFANGQGEQVCACMCARGCEYMRMRPV
eukprot:3069634-Alexandrium_andersonii.AAC.1